MENPKNTHFGKIADAFRNPLSPKHLIGWILLVLVIVCSTIMFQLQQDKTDQFLATKEKISIEDEILNQLVTPQNFDLPVRGLLNVGSKLIPTASHLLSINGKPLENGKLQHLSRSLAPFHLTKHKGETTCQVISQKDTLVFKIIE